jgi:hypothetical protein
MPDIRVFLVLLCVAGCADRPDPTTRAIEAADRDGGVCMNETAPVLKSDGRMVENFDCEDRAMRGISELVFANQE